MTPSLKAALPATLGGSLNLTWSRDPLELFRDFLLNPASRAIVPDALAATLPLGDLQSQFFQGSAPDNILQILGTADSFISEVDLYSGTSCTSAAPVEYSVSVFSGTPGVPRTIPMYAQCYTLSTPAFPGDPGLAMIGSYGGSTYVWWAVGASWLAAIQDPHQNLHVYQSVGYNNGAASNGCGTVGHWDGCSYSVAEITTNLAVNSAGSLIPPSSGAPALEMTGAGINVGYCGIQFVTNGTMFFGTGSAGGSGGACTAQEDFCVNQGDFTTPASGGICTAGYSQFSLPPIGTLATTGTGGTTYGASQYPASPNLLLNGTSTDSMHFSGPTAPIAGVPQIVFQGVPPQPNYPDISTFTANPTSQPLLDAAGIAKVSRAHPYLGSITDCPPHQGAHYHFTNTGAPYTVNVYSPVSGTVSSVQPCFVNTAGGNDQVNISIAFAKSSGNLIDFAFTMEPMDGFVCSGGVPGQDNGFFHPYVLVTPGQQVNKGDVIAHYYKPNLTSGTTDASHIHFNLQNEGNQTMSCPNIFNSTITAQFGTLYGIEACPDGGGGVAYPSTFCYQPGPGEDLTGL